MKIIALLPVKNGAQTLATYLESIKGVADQIIALNDASTDDTVEILNNHGAVVQNFPFSSVNMSEKRNFLLEQGRNNGGTHFIWLDADEAFSSDFKKGGRELILSLESGQKLLLRWVHLWKSNNQYLDDKKSPFGYIWKDFVVADDGVSRFEDLFLSEARTQGNSDSVVKISDNVGVVLHFQFQDWNFVQAKQAWYRCLELIKRGKTAARKINNTYSITLEKENLEVKAIRGEWINGLPLPVVTKQAEEQKISEIFELFDKHGIEFFEPLEIWQIKKLEDIFMNKVNRRPVIQKYPTMLIWINGVKNKFKRKLSI